MNILNIWELNVFFLLKQSAANMIYFQLVVETDFYII